MHDLFCVISTRDEVTSATVNDDVFFLVGMFCSIELMKSENVPVINDLARVCRTSHHSHTPGYQGRPVRWSKRKSKDEERCSW